MRSKTLKAILIPALLAVAPLSACAPGGNLPEVADYGVRNYKLGAGDQIRVITFGEDQLTGEFRVDDRGRIALPLLGGVQASGLTPEELDRKIEDGLREKKLLRSPSVSVEILAYRPVFVLGEVAKPGQYPYQPGMTMLTTVAIAGGFTYRGVQDYAEVVRTANNATAGSGKAVEGKITPSSYVAPGDVIKVLERRF